MQLDHLGDTLAQAMLMTGCASLDEVTPDVLVRSKIPDGGDAE
jgi:hypothetical protein